MSFHTFACIHSQAGARNSKAVRVLLDVDTLKLDKDGKLSGIDDLPKSLKEADVSKFLFDNTSNTSNRPKPSTPAINVGGNLGTSTGGNGGDSVVDHVAARLAAARFVAKTYKECKYTITGENGTFYPDGTLTVWYYPGIEPTGAKFYAGESVKYYGYVRNGSYLHVAYHATKG
nr:phage scaffolding protein [Lacticaseibacillus thailandensis]